MVRATDRQSSAGQLGERTRVLRTARRDLPQRVRRLFAATAPKKVTQLPGPSFRLQGQVGGPMFVLAVPQREVAAEPVAKSPAAEDAQSVATPATLSPFAPSVRGSGSVSRGTMLDTVLAISGGLQAGTPAVGNLQASLSGKEGK